MIKKIKQARWYKIIKNSNLFDIKYYLFIYPDVREQDMDPIWHYIKYGADERRKPSVEFDTQFYLDTYPDVKKANINPLVHYILYGKDEGRKTMIKKVIKEIKTNGIKSAINKTKKKLKEQTAHVVRHNTVDNIKFDKIDPYASKELYSYLQQRIIREKEKNKQKNNPKYTLFNINENYTNCIKNIKLNNDENPEISIVIPVYNAIKELTECLLSIEKYVSGSYEVIVADDQSSDKKIEESLTNHTSIRYIKNKKNLGFLLNVNNAINKAKGKYIFLLNSDVQLLDNSPYILKTGLEKDKSVGIVGPKIIFPDGTLQEAGCIIYKNCKTEMVGMGKESNDPAYNFSRYVDYISGASWLFEKVLFEELGGFDIKYAPAYAEDLEFCAKVTQIGKKILYMPTTTIVHHLSISSQSLSSSFKYYQSAVNKAKFIQKYQKFYKEYSKIKPIAFYLPQYHDIKQNSYWWGKNYTEWTATANARQQYKGHYQPHIPADLGFYDLTNPKIFEKQANLAKRYGIYGFCFYYYNFGDFELMEKALETFKSSNANINFCLCWANENWTKRWDGQDEDILLEQKGNDNHFFLKVLQDMERFIDDKRYIKIDGKPLVLIYRESLFDEIAIKIDLWRDYWREHHKEELYICAVDSIERAGGNANNPYDLGFDAAVEFPVHNIQTRAVLENKELLDDNNFKGHLLNYHDAVVEICTRKHPGYKRFPGCFPAWDNTPRRDSKSVIMKHQHPTSFQVFLEEKAKEALLLSGDERMIFINAWNEWGEGTHLEPDLEFGHSLLSIIDKVVKEN